MISRVNEAVTLGAQIGGSEAHVATDAVIRELRSLLKCKCPGPYSDEIREVALIIRVDGSIQRWEKSGFGNIVVRKTSGYAAADIFVDQEKWKNLPEDGLKKYLANNIIAASEEISRKISKTRIEFKVTEFLGDIREALAF